MARLPLSLTTRRVQSTLVVVALLAGPACAGSGPRSEPIRDPAVAESEPGARPSMIPVEVHEVEDRSEPEPVSEEDALAEPMDPDEAANLRADTVSESDEDLETGERP